MEYGYNGQKEAINELYPTWHGLYRNVDENTAGKLSSHHLVERYGLRCDAGTIVSVGGGSLAAYPVFLWAKKNSMFNIRYFHYPIEATIVMTVVLILVQVVLALVLLLSRHVRKNSIIERIRFEN